MNSIEQMLRRKTDYLAEANELRQLARILDHTASELDMKRRRFDEETNSDITAYELRREVKELRGKANAHRSSADILTIQAHRLENEYA